MRPAHARSLAIAALLASGFPSGGRAQSINIDFGSPLTAPPASYGAAGPAGAWNPVGVLPSGHHQPLVGLDGAATGATLYMIGGTGMLAADDPGTSGGDQSLMDDMLTGMNDPVDVCIWVDGLEEGDYQVLTYAMTPGVPDETHRVRVDWGVPGPLIVGGAWPGAHQEGVTFARHTVYAIDGEIALHSGEWGAQLRSGMNGIQLVASPGTSAGSAGPAPTATLLTGARPNPSPGRQEVRLRLGERASGDLLEIADVTGRVVWRRAVSGPAGGEAAVEWDGRDDTGRALPPGIYLARVRGGAGAPLKLVRLP